MALDVMHNEYDMGMDIDFGAMLEDFFQEKETVERGEIVVGTIVATDRQGLIVGIEGVKRDGLVPLKDLDRAERKIEDFTIGDEIDVMVLRLEDDEGNLLLSVSQARQLEDWKRAEKLMESEEVFDGIVADANRGGIIVPFGQLRGFVPASHVMDLPRGLNEDERRDRMNKLVNKEVKLKVIEVNRKRRRLVFSQRDAMRGNRENRKEQLLGDLREGETRKGVVSGLRDFGAFVDLGGADGLIHISEMAWHRVNDPKEILKIGQEVEVYVLRLDAEGKRIGLSLKRLQQNPWARVEEMYHVGQLVEGTVSRVADFGAFVSMEPGIEALLHSSQITTTDGGSPSLSVREGQLLYMRIISIEADKQRLGLSLKEVTAEERDRWATERGIVFEAAAAAVETEVISAADTDDAPPAGETESGQID